MCQARDAGHSGGLKHNQPGHRQQGVNLTLIIHTNVSSANMYRASALCKHIYTGRMHRKKETNTHWVDSFIPLQSRGRAFSCDGQMHNMDFFHPIPITLIKYR